MGAEPWQHIAPYEQDIAVVVEKLKQKVFSEGDYRGADENPSSIDEALEMMDADGTCSILDMMGFANEREIGMISPLSEEELEEFFGTTTPTLAEIEEGIDLVYEELDRGVCVYATAFENGQPSQIVFVGYSYD